MIICVRINFRFNH